MSTSRNDYLDRFPECTKLKELHYISRATLTKRKQARKEVIVLSVRLYPWQDKYTCVDLAILNTIENLLKKRDFTSVAQNLYGLEHLSCSEYLTTKEQISDKVVQWTTIYDKQLSSCSMLFRQKLLK